MSRCLFAATVLTVQVHLNFVTCFSMSSFLSDISAFHVSPPCGYVILNASRLTLFTSDSCYLIYYYWDRVGFTHACLGDVFRSGVRLLEEANADIIAT